MVLMLGKGCGLLRLSLRTGSDGTRSRDGMPVLEERCKVTVFRLLLRTGSNETPGRDGMPVPVPVEDPASGAGTAAAIRNADPPLLKRDTRSRCANSS
jgi:hypothetical protein